MSWPIHRPTLSGSWYPGSKERIDEFLQSVDLDKVPRTAWAAIGPHAGWVFSGKGAARAVASLAERETIILIGGHLHPSQGVQILPYSGYATPAGRVESDLSFIEILREEIDLEENPQADNTTEVFLPLIAALRPGVRLIVLRAPPSKQVSALVEAIERSSARSGRDPGILASTDLTHYGDPYGFTPRGDASVAIDWVKEENDRALIDAALNLDWRGVIQAGVERRAACSGAAAAAVYYAARRGATRGELLSYHTSYDLRPGDIIVGYGVISFPQA